MLKQDYSIKQIVKYFREVSVVVIGVAVTLSLSYWIGINNEKRDMRLYLNAIKLELEDNYQVLEDATENYRATHAYSNYLRAHRKSELEKDSILAYSTVWYSAVSIDFKKNAFEMFKSSGTMRLVDDKELLLSLWDVYDELRSVKDTFEWFVPIKWEDMKKEISLLLDDKEVKVPMYNFHVTGMPYQILQPCERALEKAKEMILTLEKDLSNK